MPSPSIEVDRRAVIAGLGAAAWAPRAWASDTDDAALRQALDAVDPKAPERGLALLAPFSEVRLSPGSAIDLDTVRAGLAIDERLQTATGAARYALQIERHLGEAVTPAVAHAMLDSEVRDLTWRVDRALRGVGFSHGSTGARFRDAFADPRFHYPDTSTGRDAAVVDMNRRLDRQRAHISAQFPAMPAFVLDVSARRMSPVDEAARRGGYRVLPTPDKSGAYYVDLADIVRRPRWSLAGVVRHELLPGHMIQLPTELLASPHPLRLGYLDAFAEGWAIYAEEAAGHAERGWEALGSLHWLLFRALRGLADTGIHHAGWSPERMTALLKSVQGVPAYFAPFDIDVARIVREPGVRTAEALCWLRIRQLRRAFASRLSARRFHAIMLGQGRQRIDRLAAKIEI